MVIDARWGSTGGCGPMPVMSIHGCHVHVDDSGGPDPPILFLHGLLFDGRMFDPQVDALGGRHRCITMDFRGQGRSGPARGGFQLEQQTADALTVLRRLEVSSAHLVGLSMGGYVSMRIASRHPDRVLSLSLLNTGAGPHPVGKYPEHVALAALARALGPAHPRVTDGLERAMFAAPFRSDPATAALRQQWRARWAQIHVPSLLRTLAGIMRRPDFRAELADIQAPTLVLTGSRDAQHPPEHAQQIVDNVPGSSYVELPDVGHSATIEAPREVSAAIGRLIG